jgi:CubicO group peptidase (beta-lactamase class C family)
MISKIFLSTALLINSFSLLSAEPIKWPVPNWEINTESEQTMGLPQCQAFVNYAMKQKDFNTDGLVVVKDGMLQYESYTSHYDENKPHILWSVSKTITGMLLGTAVKDGKVNLEQKLSEFYPQKKKNENYEKITLNNLLYLDSGFLWSEFYSGDVKNSSVVNMLYGPGHQDMAAYAANRPVIAEGPGYEWNYSTGTPTITMGVLKKAYGKSYEQMPWKNLAEPLGLSHFTFERDPSGTFNGGALSFATPREMAKIGYLLLNKGKWINKTILTEDWINKMLTVSPGYLSHGTTIKDITDDGVYGGSLWLNTAVKPGFGKPYPYSPEDMFMAIGHYGQLIIVLPSQKMVIARTGFDKDYNGRIDEFVTRAISCFADPSYPVGKYIPAPKSDKGPLSGIIETLKSGIAANILQPTLAKNLCSCHFVSGISVKDCYERSYVPMARTFATVSLEKLGGVTTVSATPTWLGTKLGLKSKDLPAAHYDENHSEYGCTLE